LADLECRHRVVDPGDPRDLKKPVLGRCGPITHPALVDRLGEIHPGHLMALLCAAARASTRLITRTRPSRLVARIGSTGRSSRTIWTVTSPYLVPTLNRSVESAPFWKSVKSASRGANPWAASAHRISSTASVTSNSILIPASPC